MAGRSTTVLDVLVAARRSGLKLRVVVVDSRPRLEGRQMLRQLVAAGVPCTYGLISALSHLMKEVGCPQAAPALFFLLSFL